jgi:hypothetical protein
MNRFARRARRTVTVAALALGALCAGAPFAAASTTSSSFKVPFTDPNVDGWLTFCNRNDQPITSGSLYTTPFAWKTISSSPPPAGYRNSAARVTLYAYQPIRYVDPGDWSGSLLTAGSTFTNPDHPVVQATNADLALIGFTQAYPPHWDGLLEMRMMYTAVNKPQLQMPYAAAVLRISGNTWTLVEGGGGSCSAGQGVSRETVALPKKDLAKRETTVPGAHGSSAHAAKPHGSAATGHSPGGQSSGGSNASGAKLAASDSSAGISGGALAGIVVGALALIWAGIGLIAFRRRRRVPTES